MPTTLERWSNEKAHIGLRWQITRSGDLLVGWPPVGLEDTMLALGWLTDDTQIGVIEHPSEAPIDSGILEILDERFPGRRWFAGDWDADIESSRLAA